MQATDILAPNISFAGQGWGDTTSFLVTDFRKSPPHSLIEHWSGQIESIVNALSEKADQLTREESVNFGKLLEENDRTRKHFCDTIEKGFLALWRRRKSGLKYVSHCRIVCNTGLNLSTTAAKRLILQAHVRDSGDPSAPAVQVTGTLLTDEQQTNKLSSVDLPQSSGSQVPQPNNPEDSKLCLNESSFFNQAENVDISESHIVSASGDYNDNNFTLNFIVNVNSPVQTSDIETGEPGEIHSETCREEPQHIDGIIDLTAPDDRARTSLANQGGTLHQNRPTSHSSDTEGAGSVTHAASEIHISFEDSEALWQTRDFLPLMFNFLGIR